MSSKRIAVLSWLSRGTRGEMLHVLVGLKILFLLASSQGASSQFPLPLIYLEMPSDPLMEGDSVKIFCVAPRKYTGAHFYLLLVGQARPLQMLPAAEAQHFVAFLLENVTSHNTGTYRCQYGVLNGSQLQPSQRSDTVEITVEAFVVSTVPPTSPPGSDCQDPSRILLIALSVTGGLLLVTVLLGAAMAFGRFKERRRQKKKEADSCWTEGRRCTTELSFDNCVLPASLETRKLQRAEMPRSPQPGAVDSQLTATRNSQTSSPSEHQSDLQRVAFLLYGHSLLKAPTGRRAMRHHWDLSLLWSPPPTHPH
ncbi:protein HIDE1 isoform X2 [Paroedura picta]|uniref:protein HIDE1 isoform X2 n=1 Tax=Paroedura picta TaxID=143630 RepID=UPI00405700AB